MATKIIADMVGRGTTGTLSTLGNFIVGDNNTDTMTVNSRISSNLTPSDNNTYSLGTTTLQWNNAYINNLFLAASSGTDGQILYNSGSGTIGGTTSIYTNGTKLGIGSNSSNPTHSIDITSDASGGSRIRLQQTQQTNTDGPDIKFERGRGTGASPANLVQDDSIGRIEAFSYTSGTSNYTSSGNLGWRSANGDGLGESVFSIQVRSKDGTGNAVMRTKLETDAGTGEIKLTGDVIPSLDSTYKLGNKTSPAKWSEIHGATIEASTLLKAQGNATLGDTSANDLTINAKVTTNILPKTSNANSLGSNTQIWGEVYGGIFVSNQGIVDKFNNVTPSGTPLEITYNGNTQSPSLFYVDVSSISGDFGLNLTNFNLVDNQATVITLVCKQGATPRMLSGLTIGGGSTTINWQGGSTPSGNPNKKDVIALSILKDSTDGFVVLGQLVSFG